MFWKRIEQINARDAKTLIDGGEALLFDVRKPEDYEHAHVPRAILADKSKIEFLVETDDKSKPIICYCYRGVSSRVACKRLMKAGYTGVLNLKGGYAAWRKTWGE